MTRIPARRTVLKAATAILAGLGARPAAAAASETLVPKDSMSLRALGDALAAVPRHRAFESVPMILTSPDQWDAQALDLVLSSHVGPRQVFNNTEIAGYWLTVMRNALNTQIWGFEHPDFLVVSATHGSAGIALYDQAAWDKYKFAELLKMKSAANTFLATRTGDPADFENPDGPFSAADDSIPTLQRRGVVFMACHNAIWAHAELSLKAGRNPDGLGLEALAADLTNHLVPGVILTPGIVGTLPELQKAGFTYAAA